MSLLTRAGATLAAAALATAGAVLTPGAVGAAHAAGPISPPDLFYTEGAAALGSFAPGQVIDKRDVGLTLNDINGHPVAVAGTQLLYRTKNELGAPSETVTTVIRPAGVSRGVVAYLSYYDGLGATCDPSYTLRQPTPGTEKFVIDLLVSQGYTVTIPDFEGEQLDWAAGHEAGWNTLDAIRATESSLGLPSGTPVGMMGYSGGSIAGDWASELATAYAPELDLVATAIGGVPVNLGHVMGYVDGSTAWSGVIPAAMDSLGRAYGIDFASYESDQGKAVTAEVDGKCIADFAHQDPALHVADLLDPAVATDLFDVPGVTAAVNGLIMGTGGTPRMPMLIVQGNSDGTGDGIMVAADVASLATTYRSRGVPVQYTELTGQDHTAAGSSFVFAALGFLGQHLPVPPTPTRHAVHATLKGHSKGHKDVLVVKAKGAAGATVTITRAGHRKVLGHGTIKKNGKVTIKVKDRNGSAKTRYRATVGATATTLGATTKVLALR